MGRCPSFMIVSEIFGALLCQDDGAGILRSKDDRGKRGGDTSSASAIRAARGERSRGGERGEGRVRPRWPLLSMRGLSVSRTRDGPSPRRVRVVRARGKKSSWRKTYRADRGEDGEGTDSDGDGGVIGLEEIHLDRSLSGASDNGDDMRCRSRRLNFMTVTA